MVRVRMKGRVIRVILPAILLSRVAVRQESLCMVHHYALESLEAFVPPSISFAVSSISSFGVNSFAEL